MAICTAAQAITAFEYWLGYYEKASSSYASTRDKSAFALNRGSGNYTYAGYLCGVQGGAWCAMQVSTAIYEACGGKADAKTVMRVWPYTNCGQMWDAAPASARFRRGNGTPLPGDVIVFTDNGTSRSHTGMVYAVDKTYVYTYEGNSANQCRKRSYKLTSTYVYGYVRPAYAEGAAPATTGELYGAPVTAPVLHTLSMGCAGPEVSTVQRIIYARGIDKTLAVDGDFDKRTKDGVIKMQQQLFPGVEAEWDGVVGAKTWAKMLTEYE